MSIFRNMEPHGITLDDYTFMSDPDNANKVLETLSPHEGDPPSMHPEGLLDSGPARVVRQWQNEATSP